MRSAERIAFRSIQAVPKRDSQATAGLSLGAREVANNAASSVIHESSANAKTTERMHGISIPDLFAIVIGTNQLNESRFALRTSVRR